MADRYVSLTGSNGAAGTIGAPWQTWLFGIGNLVAGDTLWIRGGTYTEALSTAQTLVIGNGTSFSNAITISGYPGETVVLRSVATWDICLQLSGLIHHTIWQDFTIDATLNHFGGQFINGAHHNRLNRVEVKNSINQGWESVAAADRFNEYIDCNMHHNGLGLGLNQFHGLYIIGEDTTVWGGTYHHNAGWGIHAFDAGAHPNDRLTVHGIRAYANGFEAGDGAGMIISGGDDALIYNNLFYANANNGLDVCMYGGGGSNARVLNNSTYGNGGYGVRIGSGSSGAIVRNNITYGDAGGSVQNLGSGTIGIGAPGANLTTDPSYTLPGSDIFTLGPASAAIDAGQDLSAIFTDDFDGNLRSAPWDIGAYDAAGGVPPPAGVARTYFFIT